MADATLDPTTAPASPESDAGGPPEAREGSLLSILQAKRREAETARRPTLSLVIPGYDGRLAVVYRFPEGGAEIAMKAAEREKDGSDEARVNGSADLLIACTASVVGRKPDEKVLVNLETDEVIDEKDTLDPSYPALRFNATLAQKFGINYERDMHRPGRYVCREVFSPRRSATGIYEGDLALIAQSNVLFAWLQSNDERITEEQAGE